MFFKKHTVINLIFKAVINCHRNINRIFPRFYTVRFFVPQCTFWISRAEKSVCTFNIIITANFNIFTFRPLFICQIRTVTCPMVVGFIINLLVLVFGQSIAYINKFCVLCPVFYIVDYFAVIIFGMNFRKFFRHYISRWWYNNNFCFDTRIFHEIIYRRYICI